MRRVALLLVPLALTLAACGSDDETTTTATTAGGSGDCRYLDLGDVNAATGATLEEVAAGEGGCTFAPPSGAEGPRVALNRIDIAIDPKQYADGAKENCKGERTDVSAGDVGWACVTINPQGIVIKDRTLLQVDVTDAADDAAGVAIAAKLVPAMKP
ncbi:MAG: hypothetical protein M0P31_05240 [Solirubrobacteraceae bacterium]|nr:hypothetical protein [Solirubrobacteraceae bacterium]